MDNLIAPTYSSKSHIHCCKIAVDLSVVTVLQVIEGENVFTQNIVHYIGEDVTVQVIVSLTLCKADVAAVVETEAVYVLNISSGDGSQLLVFKYAILQYRGIIVVLFVEQMLNVAVLFAVRPFEDASLSE